MPRKSDEIRNREQRERQQRLRVAGRKAKRPDRDDIARTALFMTISSMAAKGATDVLEDFQDRVVRMLVEQGFDERESDIVFEELVAKYRTGHWPFRRKVHLLHPEDPDRDA
ncbi:hypothetical protein N5K21_19355 [Rhizobium pusense]|uniref:Uncharacterized protein n=1 Tax=Agrobacterium pusense TaxID=648995 RepID=A0A6H0ZT34_9HYPH|nr:MULTISPECIES: hypothetical protein [Rhizobium/Agrobacterium group]MDH2090896.1 hypothetical protein [Agrobacterium pusense]QIX24002.1 hypothetical protein FOB41_23030 [Agrobacterium pusense]WCK26471.1 hypothetical protein CFBP5496_0019880 [Agrobacterium pusense]CAD7057806.1 hypothetical protein RP007_05746 [Rhizobium sp. P007]